MINSINESAAHNINTEATQQILVNIMKFPTGLIMGVLNPTDAHYTHFEI